MSAAGLTVCVCGLAGAQTNPSVVRGWVTDAQGRAIPGASIGLATGSRTSSRGSTAVASATTSATGEFELASADVQGIVTVRAQGYAPKRMRWPANSQAPLQVTLEKAARLQIHVRNHAGVLVPATVVVSSYHPGNVVESIVHAPAGVAVIGDALSGRTRVFVRSRGLAPASRTIQLAAGESPGPIEFQLEAAGSVAGLVVDRGHVQAGAEITVVYDSGVPMGAMLASAIRGKRSSNRDGGFELTEIVPGVPVRIIASVAGRRAEAVVLVQPGEAIQDLQLMLE